MAGKGVVSVAEPDITEEDGQRTLIRQILGAIAEYEGWLIRARLRAGREMKKAQGGYASGRPPYGYRASRGTLVEVPEEQTIIRKVKKLRRGGLSFRRVAARLDAEGDRPRTGNRWHPTTVARIVATERPRSPTPRR
jgi:DNA invertase Pin-like site-specific DNA recombinase